jgi:type II secretory pathway pseudopilin PulG
LPPASDWRTQAAIVFGLHAAHQLFESLRIDHALLFAGPLDVIAHKADEVLRTSLHIVAVVAALQLLDRPRASRRNRTPRALLALAAAASASAVVVAHLFPYEPLAVRVGGSASLEAWFWYSLWRNMLIGLFALVAVDGLRRRQQAVEQLATAQERGRLVRQQLASAQLLAIQARVDPQLLFDMLAAVKRGYEQDAQRAEALLDDLTAFLRAALPRLRSAHSTLEVEVGLVRSYARLLRGAGAAPIELAIDLPADLAMARFPPGVLLPLLAGVADGAACGPRSIALDARLHGSALRVRVVDSAGPAAATLERLRRSLRDLYAEHGRLRLLAQAPGAGVELEVPHERA